MLRVEFRS
ncbi:468d74c0-c44b-4c06-8afc-54ebec5af3d8 [Thermothielavioides terrestris]|uniref:468d74c0-c44b-4c06-8afc-54ebec5af3d8 n=1 Tax=Thermothielavioides terrestris TaxID=2587410 RepID=A0A3S4F4I1_9PEZI|nr:468d74c0-c44b-4c06-8afc-54ebec5af3d8 [Thermothielavioides terrestris]